MTVLYTELRPQQFRERRPRAHRLPAAGTLEWHGEHPPLGPTGCSRRDFVELAQEVGGIVLPMLFVGPDRQRDTPDGPLFGMDLCLTDDPRHRYPNQQLAGSAYWVLMGRFMTCCVPC